MASGWTGQPVLALLAGKVEDRFTEFLVHLLQAPDVLRVFMKELCDIKISDTELSTLSAKTQLTVQGGRPDLAIQGPVRYCLFEAKVDAWLHEGQLIPYADELQKWRSVHPEGTAHLFLLAPSYSARGLLQTAHAQLGHATMTTLGVRVLVWEKVAEVLGRISEHATSPRLQIYLQDFRALVTYYMGEMTPPFNEEEILLLRNPLVARAMLNARSLVGRIASVIQEKYGGVMEVTSDRATGPRWDGRNLNAVNRWWWFGFWPDAWASAGGSALFLQLPGFREQDGEQLPSSLTRPLQYRTSHNETGWVVPLELRENVELAELAAEHAATIHAWVKEFPASGKQL